MLSRTMHCPHCHQLIDDSPAITAAGKDISKWLAVIGEILAGSQPDATEIRQQIAKLKQSGDVLDTAIKQTENKGE